MMPQGGRGDASSDLKKKKTERKRDSPPTDAGEVLVWCVPTQSGQHTKNESEKGVVQDYWRHRWWGHITEHSRRPAGADVEFGRKRDMFVRGAAGCC